MEDCSQNMYIENQKLVTAADLSRGSTFRHITASPLLEKLLANAKKIKNTKGPKIDGIPNRALKKA